VSDLTRVVIVSRSDKFGLVNFGHYRGN